MDNSKTRIYDSNYVLYDLVDRYQAKGIVFPSQSISLQRKQMIVREALDALLYGIPYPQVYVSELQSGQFLLLETDNRLRYLIEYITGKFCLEMSGLFLGDESYYDKYFYREHIQFVELTAKNRQDILRSRIPLCIIEYETPLYMHLKIGSYINNWTVEQEEAVRRVLYFDKGISILQDALCINPRSRTGLSLEAEFIVFLTYIVNFIFNHHEGSKVDQYHMQEIMFESVRYLKIQELAYIYKESKSKLTHFSYGKYDGGSRTLNTVFRDRLPNIKPANGHILGMAACLCSDIYDIEELVECAYGIIGRTCSAQYDREIVMKLRNSDLSNLSLKQIINEFR